MGWHAKNVTVGYVGGKPVGQRTSRQVGGLGVGGGCVGHSRKYGLPKRLQRKKKCRERD
jgi:hypothetical protein